jgi:hypothetical protein
MLIGADTHRDRHAAAVLDRNDGLVAQLEIDCDQAGLEALLRFVTDRAPGRRCWALEGSGCCGAGLASFLLAQDEWVVEVDRPKRPRRRTSERRRPGRSPDVPLASLWSPWSSRASCQHSDLLGDEPCGAWSAGFLAR